MSGESEFESESVCEDFYAPLVWDNGSYMMKAGFSGDDAPRAVFPNIYGEPKFTFPVGPYKKNYVGDEVSAKKGILKWKYPIQKGQILDWDAMEAVWDYTIKNELRVDSAEHGIFLTTSPLTSYEEKQKIAQIMFESFSVPKLSLKLAEECSFYAYASGRQTGTVVSSGFENTFAIPIVDGKACKDAIEITEFGGRHLLEHFIFLMGKRGYSFSTSAERNIARDMKEKLCSVMENANSWNLFKILNENNCSYSELVFNTLSNLWGEERNSISDTVSKYLNYSPIPHDRQDYELPSGNLISMEKEQYLGPELLFNPSFGRKYVDECTYGVSPTYEQRLPGCRSIQQITHDAIVKAGPNKELYNNIVLAGGNTMFSNISDRLESEIIALTQDKFINQVRVISLPERKYSAWIGGSILTQMSFFEDCWMTQAHYDENGPSVVQRFS